MAGKDTHVSNILAEVFKRGGMKRAVRRAEAVLLWPQVVGSEVAKFTHATSLQDGVLFVTVPDSETSMHLMLQRQRFLNVYQGKFGVRDVREIRFRVGRPNQPDHAPEPNDDVAINAKDLAKFARDIEALQLPDDLAQPAMQAAKALLRYRARREAEGWLPCELCGALTDTPDMCMTCQRYAQVEKVKQASHALVVNPLQETPLLSEDERSVAIYLAKAYLKDRLAELLPQVLADPALKHELQSVARCYLAHRLAKPVENVTEEDFDLLDTRIARALGRWQ